MVPTGERAGGPQLKERGDDGSETCPKGVLFSSLPYLCVPLTGGCLEKGHGGEGRTLTSSADLPPPCPVGSSVPMPFLGPGKPAVRYGPLASRQRDTGAWSPRGGRASIG